MNNQFYVGSTKDIRKRLKNHNEGDEISTKKYMPWELIYYEAFKEEKIARNRVQKLKQHGNAIRELKKRIGIATASIGAGFTLIELLIVVMILGILASFVLVTLNPLAQIKKGQDAKRQQELKQLSTALDTYYNDNNSYPVSPDSVIGKTIQVVPNDPAASSTWPNYAYIEDQSSSQWNVLFAKLAFPSTSASSCALAQMQGCLPQNYQNLGYNYCIVSGSVNCSQISNTTITPLPVTTAPVVNTPTPTNGPTPTPTPIPTSVPSVCYCKDATFWIDSSKDPSHQCQVVQTSSDPSINFNRLCSSPCVNPCTP